MVEIWRDIENWNGRYQLSNLGNGRSVECSVDYIDGRTLHYKTKPLKIHIDSKGYCQLVLHRNNEYTLVSVHREIAKLFKDLVGWTEEAKGKPFEELEVNHKDENPLNNCVDNLEWCTHKYNVDYSQAKPVIQYNKSGEFVAEYPSLQEAGRQSGVTAGNICRVLKGLRKTAGGYVWKYK